jgi:hypothetical protein
VSLSVTPEYEGSVTASSALLESRGFFDAAAAIMPQGAGIPPSTGEGGYLIITAPQFLEAIGPLADWKREKGLDVTVVTTGQTGTGREQIQAYIRALYETAAPPPQYVLLVGDVEQLPTFDFHGNVSDLPYMLMDGDDFLPDLFAGRLSVRNEAEAQTVVAKILRHERDPFRADGGAWMGRGLVVSGSYGSETPVPVGQWCAAEMRAMGIAQVDSVEFPPHFQSGTPLIRSFINGGVSLVSYRGWAYGPEGWDRPMFLTRDIPGLTNGWMLPVVFSFVCLNNRFDEVECFGEAWLRAGTSTEPKGGVAFIGNGEHWSHTRFNDAAAIGAFDGMRRLGVRELGSILLASKLNILSQFPLEIPYQTEAGESVEFYFYIYNLLGDPEMDIWAGPARPITVTHDASVPRGSNFVDVRVVETGGDPLAGVRVGVSRGSVRLGCGWTDGSGVARIPVAIPDAALPLAVAVTGRNVVPYRGAMSVVGDAPYLALGSFAIDDDGAGASLGNGDGVPNPGERLEIMVTLRNDGASTAPAPQGALSACAGIQVITPGAAFPDIAAGASGTAASAFVVAVAPDAENGRVLRPRLEVVAGADTSRADISLAVVAPDLMFRGALIQGDGVIRQGARADLAVGVANEGSIPAAGVTAVLRSRDTALAVVVDSLADFGYIAVGAEASNADTLSLRAGEAVPSGQAALLTLVLTTSDGAVCATDFAVPIGSAGITAPLGPDLYGYWAHDCTDTDYPDGCPVYEWIECSTLFSGAGTKLTIPDNDQVAVDLPFAFTYYGKTYSRILVSDNGWISFDLNRAFDYYNWSMPNIYGSGAQVAAFWDNLDPGKKFNGVPAGDGIYVWNDEDHDRFVIEWSRLGNADQNAMPPQRPTYFDDLQTFEIVLYDPAVHATPTGDGVIEFLYKQIRNVDAGRMYATVGVENEAEDDGLQVTYSNVYPPEAAPLSAGLAIRFSTVPARYSPVTLAAFAAEPSAEGVELSWTPSDARPRGGYRVYRRGDAGLYERVNPVTLPPDARSFADSGADPGVSHWYKLGSVDPMGRETVLGPFLYAGAEDEPPPSVPGLRSSAAGAGSVRFVYDVPRAGDVSLRVFDVSGRSVRTLAKGPVEAGSWSATWDGRDESGRRAAAGVYIARLRTQSGARTVKFAYVR